MLKKYFSFPFKKSVCVLLLAGTVYVLSSSFKTGNVAQHAVQTEDSVLSKKAFLAVYDVFMSPRCMNCHPAGDVPLVGDDSHLHTQSVKRGKEGKGMYAVKCVNCHTDENQSGKHMPPGSPNWHMPAADMKLVFQGKTARELAGQLLDPAFNGNKSRAELVNHISSDGLVLVSWNEGEGRTQPPLTHAVFVTQFKLWIDNGAYLPD